jgi:hypothetical protein
LNLRANAKAAQPRRGLKYQISLYFPAKQGIRKMETGSLTTASTASPQVRMRHHEYEEPRAEPSVRLGETIELIVQVL